MRFYRVKLNHWTTPVTVLAETAHHARHAALAQYPVCDCCSERTKVEWVGAIDRKLMRGMTR